MKILIQSLFVSLMLALVAVPAVGAQAVNFVTVAGSTGSQGHADGTNGAAQFYQPAGIAEDASNNLYVADSFNNTIRKLTPVGTNWVVTTIAGTPGPSSGDVDGTNGAAAFDSPVGIAVDTNGNLYVCENGYNDNTIRKITPVGTNWVVTTIVGQPGASGGYADGTNQAALFNGPYSLTVDSQGILYVADTFNNVIRKVTPVGTNWVVTTIAGTQNYTGGYADGTNGDAAFNEPGGLAFDKAGNLFVSDTYNYVVRKMTPDGTNWVVTTIAGSPTISGGNDGTNGDATFGLPLNIAMDSAGNFYVADYGNSSVRRIMPVGTNWVVSTISGTGVFNRPWGATVDGADNLFVTDNGYSTVLMGGVAPPPVAAFSGTPTSGTVPLTVTFTNLSSTATNFVWDFGDGTVLNTTANTNVTETYTNTGSYTVILTATGPGGVSAQTNTDYIAVSSSTTTNVPNPTIQYVGGNTVRVSWPNTGNYTLQTNGDLTLPWVNYGGPVTTSNGTNSVTFALPPSGNLFCRLVAGSQVVTVPNLTIVWSPNIVEVSWPATGAFTLQTNADLTMPNWGDYGGTINTGNGTNSAAFAPSAGTLFFRLRQ